MAGRRGTRLVRACVGAIIAAATVGASAAPLLAQEMSATEIMRRLQLQRSTTATTAATPEPSRQAALTAGAPATGAAVRTVMAEPDDQRIDLEILFDSGSAELAPRAEAQLSQLCLAMRADLETGARYQIIGHTDAVGDGRENLILSQSRAESVVSWLAGPACQLNPHRLTPVGLGETRLKLPDAPDAAVNRRVEIQIRS